MFARGCRGGLAALLSSCPATAALKRENLLLLCCCGHPAQRKYLTLPLPDGLQCPIESEGSKPPQPPLPWPGRSQLGLELSLGPQWAAGLSWKGRTNQHYLLLKPCCCSCSRILCKQTESPAELMHFPMQHEGDNLYFDKGQ